VAKIAILSDIHGNLPALTAVLAEVDAAGVEEVFFGGDTVGYGAKSAECVALVRARGGRSVLGNHDFYALRIRRNAALVPPEERRVNPVWAGVAHAAETMDDDAAEWLASLPMALDVPRGILAHAALHRADEWPYLHSLRDAGPTLKNLRRNALDVGFFGHTHRQDIFADTSAAAMPDYLEHGRIRLPEKSVCAVLVGSVGQPRDTDRRAAWTIWDPDERIVEFRRTVYPAVEAAMQIILAGLPKHSAERLLDAASLRALDRFME
jgi:predicted phosphodiesterase